MLQYSKFVNTKAFYRAGQRKSPVELPPLARTSAISTTTKNELPENSTPEAGSIAPEPEKTAPAGTKYGSLDLKRMRQQEDLKKTDEDWLAFFLGMTEPKKRRYSTCTALVPANPATAGQPTSSSGPIIVPPPPPTVNEEPRCLDDIFREMIAEDIVFKRTTN
jgi:hypothetical protein